MEVNRTPCVTHGNATELPNTVLSLISKLRHAEGFRPINYMLRRLCLIRAGAEGLPRRLRSIETRRTCENISFFFFFFFLSPLTLRIILILFPLTFAPRDRAFTLFSPADSIKRRRAALTTPLKQLRNRVTKHEYEIVHEARNINGARWLEATAIKMAKLNKRECC